MFEQIKRIKKYAAIRHRKDTPKKKVYLHKEDGIYYLSRYVRKADLEKVSLSKRNFVKCYWKYKNGDERALRKIDELYLSAVEDFVISNNLSGDILITCIPRSNGGVNALYHTVMTVSTYADIKGVRIHNGSWVLRRTEKIAPIHKGNSYSKERRKETLTVEKLPACDAVIVLDDVVKTGNTFRAAKELLLEAGARQVDCLCLFKV